jgi:hypothetical protein
VVKRSVFGSVPDDEKMQEARRKQRRLVEEADREHMRTFGITPRRSWRVSCGRNAVGSRCRMSWFSGPEGKVTEHKAKQLARANRGNGPKSHAAQARALG